MIQISCPSCGKQYRLNDTSAGKKLRCNGCHAVMNVPKRELAAVAAGAEPMAALQALSLDDSGVMRVTSPPRKTRKRRTKLVLAAGCLLAAPVLALAFWPESGKKTQSSEQPTAATNVPQAAEVAAPRAVTEKAAVSQAAAVDVWDGGMAANNAKRNTSSKKFTRNSGRQMRSRTPASEEELRTTREPILSSRSAVRTQSSPEDKEIPDFKLNESDFAATHAQIKQILTFVDHNTGSSTRGNPLYEAVRNKIGELNKYVEWTFEIKDVRHEDSKFTGGFFGGPTLPERLVFKLEVPERAHLTIHHANSASKNAPSFSQIQPLKNEFYTGEHISVQAGAKLQKGDRVTVRGKLNNIYVSSWEASYVLENVKVRKAESVNDGTGDKPSEEAILSSRSAVRTKPSKEDKDILFARKLESMPDFQLNDTDFSMTQTSVEKLIHFVDHNPVAVAKGSKLYEAMKANIGKLNKEVEWTFEIKDVRHEDPQPRGTYGAPALPERLVFKLEVPDKADLAIHHANSANRGVTYLSRLSPLRNEFYTGEHISVQTGAKLREGDRVVMHGKLTSLYISRSQATYELENVKVRKADAENGSGEEGARKESASAR